MEGHPEGARPTVRCVCLRSGEESVRLGRERRRPGALRPFRGLLRAPRGPASEPACGRVRAGSGPAPRAHVAPCLSSPSPSRHPNTSKELPVPPPSSCVPSPPTSSQSRFFSAGRFLSTTLAERFFSRLPRPTLPRGLGGGLPPPHGWPKMENAQRRKMEARRLRVACSVASSPPGAS